MDLFSSSRSSVLDVPPTTAWERLVAGGPGPHWYDDALPLRFRGWLDELVGGSPPEDAPDDHIRSGDRAGFWTALRAAPPTEESAGVLDLQARVRAPGRVRLRSTVARVVDRDDRCCLTQEVSFAPSGLLGTAYLLADLPAREVVIELVHRRTRAELAQATS